MFGAQDVCRLTAFIATTQQQNESSAVSPAVDAVTSTHMQAQLDDTFADRLTIAKIAGLHLAQPNPYASLRQLVTHAGKPFCKWLPTIVTLISKDFHRIEILA